MSEHQTVEPGLFSLEPARSAWGVSLGYQPGAWLRYGVLGPTLELLGWYLHFNSVPQVLGLLQLGKCGCGAVGPCLVFSVVWEGELMPLGFQ